MKTNTWAHFRTRSRRLSYWLWLWDALVRATFAVALHGMDLAMEQCVHIRNRYGHVTRELAVMHSCPARHYRLMMLPAL